MRLGRGPAPAVTAVDLSKSFGPVEAVQGVSFEVARGEIFALLGPSGAGKSTIIGMLCALTEPTGGRATVAGYDVVERTRAVRRRVRLVTGGESMLRRPPAVLFLDEPEVVSDPAGRADLWHDIRRIRDEGATVVLATSSVHDAEQADRIAIIDEGRVAAVGTPAGLKAAVPSPPAGGRPAALDDVFSHFTGGPLQGDGLGAARRFMSSHRR